MKLISFSLIFLLSLAAAVLQSQTITEPGQQPSVSLPPELARVLADYENLWLHRDSAALARLFTEDGFVLSNGSPMVRGRVAIERFYAGPGAPPVPACCRLRNGGEHWLYHWRVQRPAGRTGSREVHPHASTGPFGTMVHNVRHG